MSGTPYSPDAPFTPLDLNTLTLDKAKKRVRRVKNSRNVPRHEAERLVAQELLGPRADWHDIVQKCAENVRRTAAVPDDEQSADPWRSAAVRAMLQRLASDKLLEILWMLPDDPVYIGIGPLWRLDLGELAEDQVEYQLDETPVPLSAYQSPEDRRPIFNLAMVAHHIDAICEVATRLYRRRQQPVPKEVAAVCAHAADFTRPWRTAPAAVSHPGARPTPGNFNLIDWEHAKEDAEEWLITDGFPWEEALDAAARKRGFDDWDDFEEAVDLTAGAVFYKPGATLDDVMEHVLFLATETDLAPDKEAAKTAVARSLGYPNWESVVRRYGGTDAERFEALAKPLFHRNKGLAAWAQTIDDMIDVFDAWAGAMRTLKAAGVRLDTDSAVIDDMAGFLYLPEQEAAVDAAFRNLPKAPRHGSGVPRYGAFTADLVRYKWLTAEAESIDDFIDAYEREARVLRDWKDAGVWLVNNGTQRDDYAWFSTNDADVARRFGFRPTGEVLGGDKPVETRRVKPGDPHAQ